MFGYLGKRKRSVHMCVSIHSCFKEGTPSAFKSEPGRVSDQFFKHTSALIKKQGNNYTFRLQAAFFHLGNGLLHSSVEIGQHWGRREKKGQAFILKSTVKASCSSIHLSFQKTFFGRGKS